MKIRTDFVTNSSSSSFVLVLRISLKNGNVLKFIGTGDPEGGAGYSEVTATTSPQKLACSKSIAELISNLKASVNVINDQSGIIRQLKKLSSPDEIDKITINGDKYGRNEQHQYAHYTYHMDTGMTAYDAGGDDYIYEEGSGGDLCFFDTDLVKGRNFGEAVSSSGYQKHRGFSAYDCDVEFDPDALAQENDRIAQLKSNYSQVRKKYLEIIEMFTYTTEEIVFLNKNFFGYVPAAVHYALGGNIIYDPSEADYCVTASDIAGVDALPVNALDSNICMLSNQIQAMEYFLSTDQYHEVRFIKRHDLQRAITLQRYNGYPAIKAGFVAWKASIPFDHFTTLDCKNKNFVFAGLTNPRLMELLLASYATKKWNLSPNVLVMEHGGSILPRVTLQCDYLIAGLDASTNSSAIKTAIQYRDGNKSRIRILPEDEFIRILNGEQLEISEEDQQAMQAREEAIRKAEEEKRRAQEEKVRLAAEVALRAEEQKKSAKALREKFAALIEEQKKQQREAKQQAVLERQAIKEELKRQDASERERRIRDEVLYCPGEEPANLRRRIDNLFAKLDEAYPDRQISRLQADHKKWAETVTELYRLLGYPDGRAFLESYGYTVLAAENKGGRPSHDVDAVIEELKRRYPNGGGKNTSQLKRDNSDLPIKTLINNAQKLFGMPLKDYLTQIGVFP